jgi:thiol-disulfide isomerase/thioredoxin
MTRQLKIIAVAVAGFVILMITATYAYDTLTKTVTPESNLAAREAIEEPDPLPEQGSRSGGGEPEKKIKATDFTVQDANGLKVNLSDMEGKPTVVNFWASWCPPCKAEMPHFDKVYREVGDDVNFMMIDLIGGGETKESGRTFMDDRDFALPLYFDVEQEAAQAYGITAIPTSIFIDSDGYITASAQGSIDEESLRRGIAMIKGAP